MATSAASTNSASSVGATSTNSTNPVAQYIDMLTKSTSCTPLATVLASANTTVDVLGVIMEIREPTITRTNDWMTSIHISDPTLPSNREFFTINVFRETRNELVGEHLQRQRLILLKNVRTKFFKTKAQGTLMKDRRFYPVARETNGTDGIYAINNPQLLAQLSSWYYKPVLTDTQQFNVPQPSAYPPALPPPAQYPQGSFVAASTTVAPTTSTTTYNYPAPPAYTAPVTATTTAPTHQRTFKECIIQEITQRTFADAYCEVLKVYPAYNKKLTMIVTDYTPNPQLRRANEESSILQNRPYVDPTMLLTVTLWDHHVDYASEMNLQPGTFLFLSNMKVKQTSDGHEANIHGARNDSTLKRHVTIVGRESPPIIALISRRSELMKACPRSAMASIGNDSGEELTITLHPEIPHSSIQVLRNAPNVPGKYKLRVSCLAAQPDKTKNWVRGECDYCRSTTPLPAQKCHKCDQVLTKACFMFSFFVGDESGYLPIIVSGAEAIEFLGGLQPVFPSSGNEQAYETLLEQLEERYQLLFGNGETTTSGSQSPVQRPVLDICVFSFLKELGPSVSSKGRREIGFKVFDTVLLQQQ